MKKTIAFFIGSMSGGGAERVISILANHYSMKGWNVDIVLLLDNKIGYQLDKRIKIIDLTHSSGSYFKRAPYWLVKIRDYVKKRNPDRIVSFIGRINVLVLTACLGLRVPIIVSERNDPKHDGRGKAMLYYCNLIYRKAKAVVYQTKYEQSCFTKSLKNGVVIANPVKVSVEADQNKDYSEIVTAGRLQTQKNQEMLIRATSVLLKDHPKIRVRIYGDGNLKEYLQNTIISLNVEESITLCGNVNDLHDRINKAGVFVLCSNYEGLSNALIEAMMLGMICITTDYPGARELIKHNYNGLIVPRSNYRRLAQEIKKILDNQELRELLSKNAIISSKNYTESKVIKKWEIVIE